jgi:hypothetical protein
MEIMRESWTDARLSDFAAHTDGHFESLERRVDEGFRRVDADLRALNGRFDSLQRTMLQIGGGVIVALLGLIATQI